MTTDEQKDFLHDDPQPDNLDTMLVEHEKAQSGAGKIHAAIIEIMRAVGPIAKNEMNTQQNYPYRGVISVYNEVHPHFAAAGVYSTSTILAAEHRECKSEKGKPYIHAILRMRFTYWASDGSHVSTEVVGEGTDYGGDKASNKAISAADKYALLQLLKIPTAMVDSDAPDHPAPATNPNAPKDQPRDQRVTKEQFARLTAAWKERNPTGDTWKKENPKDQHNINAFRTWAEKVTKSDRRFNVAKLDEWTIADFDKCISSLGLPE